MCCLSSISNLCLFLYAHSFMHIFPQTENGRIIYTNNVRAAQSTSGEITRRDTNFLMFVSCVMERDSSVGTLYEAKESANATISGTGRFNTTMAFFPSSSFSYPITESPYKVNLNQQLYIQVQLKRAEPSLHLFMDTCVASPTHNFTSRTYDLIRNGYNTHSCTNISSNKSDSKHMLTIFFSL